MDVFNISTKKAFDYLYKSKKDGGEDYNKSYPSIELVRIEKIFFKSVKKVLDFGCGAGENGIHLLKKGYEVTFCDISSYALNKVKLKIKKLKLKKAKYLLFKNTNQISKDFTCYFDAIVCLSVINNFKNISQIMQVVRMFKKIMNTGGKLVIDSNLKNKHNYKIIKKKKERIITQYGSNKFGMFFFKIKKQFKNVLSKCNFKIIDIGFAKFKVFKQFEYEIILSAEKVR
jgi:cyclopropane fatty-acyl-phospholipid synthase-like methyltransferase